MQSPQQEMAGSRRYRNRCGLQKMYNLVKKISQNVRTYKTVQNQVSDCTLKFFFRKI